jgi:hypothetical protein
MPQGEANPKPRPPRTQLLHPAQHLSMGPASHEGIQSRRLQLGCQMAAWEASKGILWEGRHAEAGPHKTLQLTHSVLHHPRWGGGLLVPAMVGNPDGMKEGDPQGGPQRGQAPGRGVARPGGQVVAKHELRTVHGGWRATSNRHPQLLEPGTSGCIFGAGQEEVGEAIPRALPGGKGCTGCGRAEVTLQALMLGGNVEPTGQAAMLQAPGQDLGTVAGWAIPEASPQLAPEAGGPSTRGSSHSWRTRQGCC